MQLQAGTVSDYELPAHVTEHQPHVTSGSSFSVYLDQESTWQSLDSLPVIIKIYHYALMWTDDMYTVWLVSYPLTGVAVALQDKDNGWIEGATV